MAKNDILTLECGYLKFANILHEVVSDAPYEVGSPCGFLCDTIKIPRGVLLPRAYLLGHIVCNLAIEGAITTTYYYKVSSRTQIFIDIMSLLLSRNTTSNLSNPTEARRLLCV